MVASPAAAMPWLGALGVGCWVLGRRNTARQAVRRTGWALAILGLATLLPTRLTSHLLTSHLLPSHGGTGLSLHFLNVGQGDAILIRTPGDRWILVDAGPAARDRAGGFGRDAGRDVVAPFLVRHGVRRLAAFVLSHAHLDHGGGAAAVLGQVPADVVLDPAVPVAEPHYLELLDLIGNRGMRWRPARTGDSLVIDGVRLHVMHPDTAWTGWRSDLNDDSVVLLIRSGSFQAVLAGDLGVRAESLLAVRIGPVDLLKVGHHGSAGSSSTAWLATLSPSVGIVSVGPNNYGHPAPQALARLADAGVEVWRTDRQGTIEVSVTGRTMTVRGRRVTRVHGLRPRE
jgi:competence protein ComEC